MKWPQSPLKAKNLDQEQLKQFLAIRADYEKCAFVTEGHLEVRALGPKEFVKPIPPGESAITALAVAADGWLYGATSGARAHLFFYNPSPDADAVADIGVVAENATIPTLEFRADHTLVGVANANGQAQFFTYKSCAVLLAEKDFTGLGVREIFDFPAEDQLFFSTIDPCHSAGQIDLLGEPLPFPVADFKLLDEGHEAVVINESSGELVRLSLVTGQLRRLGRLDPNGNFSPRLTTDRQGRIYGAGLYGRLFRYDPCAGILEPLEATAPSLRGHQLYNRVTAWLPENASGVIYGGTIDGILFRYLPAENRLVCLGKPTAETNVCALARAGHRVYALLGLPDDCAHLACYDEETGELRDLGCLLARSERPWNGYSFAAMATGRHGVVFMGENDRISQLFLFFPPVLDME